MKIASRALLVALLAPAASALQSSFDFDEPVPSAWPAGGAAGRIAAGDLTVSGFRDAVLLPDAVLGSKPVVLVDVDVHDSLVVLPEIVVDLAVFPGGAQTSDAVVTAGPGGVGMWCWDPAAESFQRETIAGPWAGADAVAAYSTEGSPWVILVVLHGGGTQLNAQIFLKDSAEYFLTVANLVLKTPATAMAAFDRDGDWLPEVALQHSGGLDVVPLDGGSPQSIVQPAVGGQLAVLRGAWPTPGERLAWIADPGSGPERLYVIHDLEVEPPVSLGGRVVVAADAADLDLDLDEDLAVLTEGGDELLVLVNRYEDPPGSPTFGTGPGGVVLVDDFPLGGPPSPDDELLLASDLDHDGDPELLAGGSLYRNLESPLDPVPSTIAIAHATPGDIVVTLQVEAPATLPSDANELEIRAWGWQLVGGGFPLLPVLAGFADHALPAPWVSNVPFDVTLSTAPPFDGIEVFFLFLSLARDVPGQPKKNYRPEAFAFARTDDLILVLEGIYGEGGTVDAGHDAAEGGGVRVDPPAQIPPFPTTP